MRKYVIILKRLLMMLFIFYLFSMHAHANASALNITIGASTKNRIADASPTINVSEFKLDKYDCLISSTTSGNNQTSNTEDINKPQNNVLDILGKVLFEFIGPTFGTFLGIIIATRDSRKRARQDKEEKGEKSANLKNMLDTELCSIQNTVKELKETQYYDYMTPTWNVIKEANVIDYLNGEELNSYISKYTTISRASHLEEQLRNSERIGDNQTIILELRKDVKKMRQYIANGFVAVDYPEKISEEHDGTET